MPVGATERTAEDLDAAGVGMDQPCEQTHGRRLASAVRSQKAIDNAVRHGQVEPSKGRSRAVAFAKVAGCESVTAIADHCQPSSTSERQGSHVLGPDRM